MRTRTVRRHVLHTCMINVTGILLLPGSSLLLRTQQKSFRFITVRAVYPPKEWSKCQSGMHARPRLVVLAKWCVACRGCVQFVSASNIYHAVVFGFGLSCHRFNLNCVNGEGVHGMSMLCVWRHQVPIKCESSLVRHHDSPHTIPAELGYTCCCYLLYFAGSC